MKKLTVVLGLTIGMCLPALAQETLRGDTDEPTLVERFSDGKIKVGHAEMNLQLYTSANANFVGRELDGMNFKLNRFRMEIKGDVGGKLTYHYRQSFNKYSDPYSLDNLSSSLELAYVGLKPRSNLDLFIGKQYVNYGGYEFYVNSIRVREFSEFNNLLTAQQAGVSGNWRIVPTQELCFQIVNNRNGDDADIYPTGLPEGVAKTKIPFLYTLNWNSFYLDKALQLRYSAAVGQQARKRNACYFTCGHVYEKGPWLAYFDVMYTRQGIDQHGLISRLPAVHRTACNTEYLSFISDIDYRFHPRWNVYLKGAYETGRVYKANGPFAEGMYRRSWNAQSSLEYFPIRNCELFVFLLYTYRGVTLGRAALDMGATEPDTHRISLGLVYTIPVF